MTEETYRSYLSEVERLAAQDPHPDTMDGAWLEFLAKLVEDYEQMQFKFRKPGRDELMLFRMQEIDPQQTP